MEQRFRRPQLYELVWSEPIAALALKLGLSGVALAKTCRRHGIPVPGRGHWAKLKAGKSSPRFPLPPRALGAPETIRIGRMSWREQKEESKRLMVEEILPPPEFTESLRDLVSRVSKMVGRVPRSRALSGAHPLISKLLADDEERLKTWAESGYPSLYDQPFFVSPYEQRRLKIVDAVFKAMSRLGMAAAVSAKKNPDEFGVRVGESTIWFYVGKPGEERSTWRATSEARRPASEEMHFEIRQKIEGLEDFKTEWADASGAPLEASLPQIVVNLIVVAEMQARDAERQQYDHRVRQKTWLIEAERERQEEAEREKLERQRSMERARMEKLFEESMPFRLAEDIRKYVAEVVSRNAADPKPVSAADTAEWERWAMAEADRIDPVISRAFLKPVSESEGDVEASRANRSGPVQEPSESQAWHPNRWYTRLHR